MNEEIDEGFCPMSRWIDIPGYDFGDCPDYGSTSCPLTMHEDEPCSVTIEDLEEVLSFKWRR
jgi:hypothetical protein